MKVKQSDAEKSEMRRVELLHRCITHERDLMLMRTVGYDIYTYTYIQVILSTFLLVVVDKSKSKATIKLIFLIKSYSLVP